MNLAMYIGLVKKTLSIARELCFQLLCRRNLVQMALVFLNFSEFLNFIMLFPEFHHGFGRFHQFCASAHANAHAQLH